jgi:hypothetical protein
VVGAVLIGVGVVAAVGATLARVFMHRRDTDRRTQLRRATGAVLIVGVFAFVVAAATT